MKRFLIVLIGFLFSTNLLSQETQDVVYLKDSTIIRGKIVKMVVNEFVTIRTLDESSLSYKFSEIEKLTQEPFKADLDEYGGKYSIGIAVGGAGLIGVPFRYYPTKKFAWELGLYSRFISKVDILEGYSFYNQINIHGGTNIFFNKFYKAKRGKIKLNGLAIKSTQSLNVIPETSFYFGWAHESFRIEKRKNSSFILELGFGLNKIWNDSRSLYSNNSSIQPSGYFKIQWSWYFKSSKR
ncbi:MAG: hypothetical protein EHM93_17405 [Bacteroidales bacterium]|nr:MAG: hypothetical protein EHM93_17405 [Bacteroidales bacterium]